MTNRTHSDPAPARRAMVERLRREGVAGERVLSAMAEVPRDRFTRRGADPRTAYAARPQPIARAQTMSAPAIVALMTEALGLTGTERVLEVGTGSGYAAAVLARCAGEVVTVEYHAGLARRARRVLAALSYDVDVRHGDGTRGAPDRAPFDAVSVTAMAREEIPPALIEQLTPDGVLVCPVGGERDGDLVRYHRGRTETLCAVRFVPLQEPGRR